MILALALPKIELSLSQPIHDNIRHKRRTKVGQGSREEKDTFFIRNIEEKNPELF